jgi:hypothetical protein
MFFVQRIHICICCIHHAQQAVGYGVFWQSIISEHHAHVRHELDVWAERMQMLRPEVLIAQISWYSTGCVFT